jgi:dihydroorotate dehydrogenase (NAD+) catalytic subunit
MLHTPFYDPNRSYDENFTQGPFGAFADRKTFKKTGKPTYSLLNQKLWQPFGIAAGPLPNSKFVAQAFKKGFDICVYKTVRSGSHPTNAFPNILPVHVEGDLTIEKSQQEQFAGGPYAEPLTISNSFGVPSKDPSFWQTDMKKAIASSGKGQLLIASFQGTKRPGNSVEEYIADHVTTARLVKEVQPKVMEINLSCPNEGKNELLCFDLERVEEICRQVKKEIGDTPLLLKLAYFPDDVQLKEIIDRTKNYVQGYSVINTIPAPLVDVEGNQALPGEGRLWSGVCGAAIKWAGLEMVQRMKSLRTAEGDDFVIIGVGGVLNADDYQQYIRAGADAVLCATGAMWNPYLAQEIWQARKQ